MPQLHRVVYHCVSEAAKAKIYHCLSEFAANQLSAPHPGVLIYHFTTPDKKNAPLTIELTEIYKDDTVFWQHLAGERQEHFGRLLTEAFTEESRTGRLWTAQGTFANEEIFKHAIGGMGAKFDAKKDAGFLVNDTVNVEALENDEEFVYARIFANVEQKDAFEKVAKSAGKGILTFYVSTLQPTEKPNRVEIILLCRDDSGADLIKSNASEMKSLLKDVEDCRVYGKNSGETFSALKSILGEAKVNAGESDIGYVLHPQARKAFP